MPPLDRHQFGGALGGALVIPGLYDGHNRTFFFADYSGIKETARRDDGQYRADRGDPHRRLQRLSRPQRQPDPDLRSADHPARRAGTRSCATSFPNNIIPADRLNPRRPQHRQHLSAPEHRQRQLRQLHLDPRSRDHRQRVLGPRRPPASRTTTRSSCGSTTASSASTRRRARRTAACRRRRRRPRDSISARSSPASRTRG